MNYTKIVSKNKTVLIPMAVSEPKIAHFTYLDKDGVSHNQSYGGVSKFSTHFYISKNSNSSLCSELALKVTLHAWMKRSRVDTESMAPTSFRCSFSPFLTQHSHFVIKFRFTFSYYRYPMSQKTALDSDSEDNDCKLCRNTFFWTSEFMEKFIGTKKKICIRYWTSKTISIVPTLRSNTHGPWHHDSTIVCQMIPKTGFIQSCVSINNLASANKYLNVLKCLVSVLFIASNCFFLI